MLRLVVCILKSSSAQVALATGTDKDPSNSISNVVISAGVYILQTLRAPWFFLSQGFKSLSPQPDQGISSLWGRAC